ncbi:MAG: DUF3379 family protein [Pseudohongiellaceae bacterium]
MDDNEFRLRAFSEPGSEDPDLHEAARGDSTRQRLMQEIAELEEHISSAIDTVAVPSGLADRLKQQVEPARTGKRGLMRFFPVAAMVVIAAAITLMPDPGNRPGAQDLAFHDELVTHLHDEAAAYDDEGSTRWAEVSGVLAAAGLAAGNGGASTSGIPLRTAGLKFARHCDLGDAGRGAHIVLEGEQGPVSVILSINKPVDRAFIIEDERFQGRIIPTEYGNMVIVGEQGEILSGYETMVADSVQWSI